MVPNLWFKNGNRGKEIKIGSVFRHRLSGDVVETAKVLDVAEDSLGIPHVTYDLMVEKARYSSYTDRRTLGLQSFYERFEEAV